MAKKKQSKFYLVCKWLRRSFLSLPQVLVAITVIIVCLILDIYEDTSFDIRPPLLFSASIRPGAQDILAD